MADTDASSYILRYDFVNGQLQYFNGADWYNGVAVSGVTTLNGLTGAVILAAGTGISLTPSGQTITITNTSSGGINQLTGDVTAGPGNGSQVATVPQFHVSTIAGTGTVTPVATVSGTFSSTVTGNLTINGPTGGYDGQKITFRIINDASHSVTFATGAGNFAFGTSITSYTNSVSLIDYVGVIYNSAAGVWHIVSVIQGF